MKVNGVYFDDIHSYDDLNLFLAPFVPKPATPKTTYVDIPGGDGSLDMTEAHGEVKYKDRDFVFTFTVNPAETMSFDEKVMQVSNALNGKRCKIILDRDAGYYWQGRCSINSYAQNRTVKQVIVNAKVKPYKYKKEETVVTVSLTSASQNVTLTNGRKTAIPTITCTGNATIQYGGVSFNLIAGEHRTPDICLKEGRNTLAVSGSGKITFKYQEADL